MTRQLRPRTLQIKPENYAISNDIDFDPVTPPLRLESPSLQNVERTIPVYQIDLSLPPSQRYVQVAFDFKRQLENLKTIFDEVLEAVPISNSILHFLARVFLRRIYHHEEMQELLGISQVVGVTIYLLVAYNVFLDLFMGCTSGGVHSRPSEKEEPRVMHFRTLDWGMPQLRDVLVQFEFIEHRGGDVIARTISYVGFVGVLTGVRKGLSVSLNFRPYHNNDNSRWANFRFRLHQIAVLLGLRPSIASVLRDFIVPRTAPTKAPGKADYAVALQPIYLRSDICATLPSIPSTAAYMIFCTEDETVILEKDRRTANILRSSSFITTTNHDASYDSEKDQTHSEVAHVEYANAGKASGLNFGMEVVVEESMDRKRCIARRWEKWIEMRSKSAKKRRDSQTINDIEMGLVKKWLLEFPVTNEDTHFACIMDPKNGDFRWVRKFDEGEIQYRVP